MLEIDKARAVIELENIQWFNEHPEFAKRLPALAEESASASSPLFVETAAGRRPINCTRQQSSLLLAVSALAAGAAQVDRAGEPDREVQVDGTVKATSDSEQAANLGISRMQLDQANASLDHLIENFEPPNESDLSEVTIPEAVAVALDLAAAAKQSAAASPLSLSAIPVQPVSSGWPMPVHAVC